jgi:ABC-type branched-subunit amino acid transport system ATPase component
MHKVKRALKEFTSSNLRRKFPRESLSLFNKLALEPNMLTTQDIMTFTKQTKFDDVWIFHGVAIERKGKAIVLAGPPGIGKSTLLRKIVRTGLAEPIDDGNILVGRRNNCYCVLKSGLYPTLRTISIISRWLRILFGYQSPYLNIDPGDNVLKAMRRGEMLHNLAVLMGSIVAKSRSSEAVTSTPVRLDKLFLVIHQKDPQVRLMYQKDSQLSRRMSGEHIESISASDTKNIFDNYLSCEVIVSAGPGVKTVMCDKVWKTIC